MDTCGWRLERPSVSLFAFPNYVLESTRADSFVKAPEHLRKMSHIMTEAGFFFIGLDDKTQCFQCGGGLKDWEESDDPWVEHALYFPTCLYVKKVKGDHFSAEVVTPRPPNLPLEEIQKLAEK